MRYRIGQSQVRLEDDTLLRGAGRFTDDARQEGELAMVFLRSPVAAGRVVRLAVDAARNAPGVIAVLTGHDLREAGLGGFAPRQRHKAPDGNEMFIPPYFPLSSAQVRFVGDPLAAVVAETRLQAEDALDMIDLDIEETPAVVEPLAALSKGAPAVWEEVPDNHAFIVERGDKAAVDTAFRQASRKVAQRLNISRVIAAALEPRNAVAAFDTESQVFTLNVGSQSPQRISEGLSGVLGLPAAQIRVIAEHTGGGFGMKNAAYPEYAVLLYAARLTGRPVRWRASRVESFLADAHAREQVADAELALDDDGHFLGLRVRIFANLGAYLGPMGTHPMVNNIPGMAGVYRTPAIHVECHGVHCHTQSMAPYRGAGRPEATYIMERMADLAARELGVDLSEIRRRNMIRRDQMPYTTALGYTYDSGDFATVMEKTLEKADWQGFSARREEARARGRLRGIGLANPIEIAGGPAGKPNPEYAAVAIGADGKVTVKLGSCDSGQGQRTVFAALLGDRLGLEAEDITFVSGDTGEVPKGTGTFGSRSTGAIASNLTRVAHEILAQAMPEAAEVLEASAADLAFEDGAICVVGSDHRITLQALARRCGRTFQAEDLGASDNCSFPNGCHVCEVEIDPETGRLEAVGYWVVDDVGTEINPMLIKGQIHGGIAQGFGQAVMEQVLYDELSGQLLTASFMDYAMPRAGDLPTLNVSGYPVPTAANPLGAKGVGEAGVVGSLPAVISAVCDALAPLGIRHIDMPATPERVWRAIRDLNRRSSHSRLTPRPPGWAAQMGADHQGDTRI